MNSVAGNVEYDWRTAASIATGAGAVNGVKITSKAQTPAQKSQTAVRSRTEAAEARSIWRRSYWTTAIERWRGAIGAG